MERTHTVFYNRLCELSKERGIPMRRVMLDVGVSAVAYRSWAKGSIPETGTIRKIATYFRVPVSGFLDPDSRFDRPGPEQVDAAAARQAGREEPAIKTGALLLLAVNRCNICGQAACTAEAVTVAEESDMREPAPDGQPVLVERLRSHLAGQLDRVARASALSEADKLCAHPGPEVRRFLGNLRDLCGREGIGEEEAAWMAGLPASLLAVWRAGAAAPSALAVDRLCAAFAVEPDFFARSEGDGLWAPDTDVPAAGETKADYYRRLLLAVDAGSAPELMNRFTEAVLLRQDTPLMARMSKSTLFLVFPLLNEAGRQEAARRLMDICQFPEFMSDGGST